MTRTLLAALLALVLLPLGALGWLAARLTRAEVERANLRVSELAAASLDNLADEADELLTERRAEVLTTLTARPANEASLRQARHDLLAVRQTFWVDPNGHLAYPSPGGDLDREESAFLRRTATIWSRELLLAVADQAAAESVSQPSKLPTQNRQLVEPPTGQFYPWHQDDGLHLLVFTRLADGTLLGAELDRIRLLADLIARLPDDDPTWASGRVRLLDAEGRVLHQWGALDPAGRRATARVALPAPLAAWSLEGFDPSTRDPRGAAIASGALPWLAALAVVVVSLAIHVYRASSRRLREAATRVSFVNQVSHELKTPLTNIRMYAELLAEEVAANASEGVEPPAPVSPTERYAAIISAESGRLSRLINNVLTFARRERRELTLHPREVVLDDVVRHVMSSFEPSFASRGLTLSAILAAPHPLRLDPDAVEQILGNLLSNVEKYAAAGGMAEVTTRHLTLAGSAPGEERVELTVSDRGPGIPVGERERIFAPFARISSALTEGVSGAGLGLTIARDLARLHQGDLTLDQDPATLRSGARFVVQLRASATTTREESAPCVS